MLYFNIKKLVYYKINNIYICDYGVEFCDKLKVCFRVKSAAIILGDEPSHCAFPGGKKISSEVSQKAIYYFYKCLF